MIEQIKAGILRQNPEGFPVPRFAGERELGEEYRDAVVATWYFPEFPSKAMCVTFSLTGREVELANNHADALAEVYAEHVVKSAVEGLADKRAESKEE